VTSLAAAVGFGILLGIATQLLQGILPGALNWIANALSGWLLAAYLFGSRMPTPRVAAAASVVMLMAALAAYYATVQVRFGYGTNGTTLLFWGIGSVAGGLVFGSAGWWWRHGGPRARAAAVGLLAALFVAEGYYFLMILPDSTVGLGAIVAGLIVPAVFGRDRRERGWGYVAMLPGLALGAVGYGVTLLMYGVLTGA
jgi:hypothetical protein